MIGIYDSGLGGLSVWQHLRLQTSAKLLYFGDTCHVPYGEKTSAQLEGYFWNILNFFLQKGCQGVVVACNTSSALVLPRVITKVQVPVFGIIESAIDASLRANAKRIGILATRGTVASGAYEKAFAKRSQKIQVFMQSAPRLVPLVECGQHKSQAAKVAIQEYLEPLLIQNIDTILLGCTHYPFLEELIIELAGPHIQIINPAPSMALQIAEVFPNLTKGCVRSETKTQFWVSGNPEEFKINAELLLQEQLPEIRFHKM